jgi:hypothetical protein
MRNKKEIATPKGALTSSGVLENLKRGVLLKTRKSQRSLIGKPRAATGLLIENPRAKGQFSHINRRERLGKNNQ